MIRICQEEGCEVPAVMIVWEEEETVAERLMYCAEHGDRLVAAGDGALRCSLFSANSPVDVPSELIGSMPAAQRIRRQKDWASYQRRKIQKP